MPASPPAATRLPGILHALDRAYPDAGCTLNYSTPLELLVATILSAQCTDVLVNKVTPDLFRKYRNVADYAAADPAQLERDVSRVNFFRTKAKSIQRACQVMLERFGGKVPSRMEDLLELPGVARKTANVVLGNAFGQPVGVVVDTHVMRLSQRLALTPHTDRDKIEQDLMALLPKPRWTTFSHQIIQHGRQVCRAKAPQCSTCQIGEALCPSFQRSRNTRSR
jgi:endonuclease-3